MAEKNANILSGADGQSIHYEQKSFSSFVEILESSLEKLRKSIYTINSYDNSLRKERIFYERAKAGKYKLLSTEVICGTGNTIKEDLSNNVNRIYDLIKEAKAVMSQIKAFEDSEISLQDPNGIESQEVSELDTTSSPSYYYTGTGDYTYGNGTVSLDTTTPVFTETSTTSNEEENKTEDTLEASIGEPAPELDYDEENKTEDTLEASIGEPAPELDYDEENKTEDTVNPDLEETSTLTDEEKAQADKTQYTNTVIHELENVFKKFEDEYSGKFSEVAIITTSITGGMTSLLVDLNDSESLQNALNTISEEGIDVGGMVSILAYGDIDDTMYFGEITSLKDADGNVLLDQVQYQDTLINSQTDDENEPTEDTLNEIDDENISAENPENEIDEGNGYHSPFVEFKNVGPDHIDIVDTSSNGVSSFGDSYGSPITSSTPQFDTTIEPTIEPAVSEPVYTFESHTPIIENPELLTVSPGISQDTLNNVEYTNSVLSNNTSSFSSVSAQNGVDIIPVSPNTVGNVNNNSYATPKGSSNIGINGALVGATSAVTGATLYNALGNASKGEKKNDFSRKNNDSNASISKDTLNDNSSVNVSANVSSSHNNFNNILLGAAGVAAGATLYNSLKNADEKKHDDDKENSDGER